MRYSCAVKGCDEVGRHWWNKVKGVRKPVRMANLCLEHRNAWVALLAGRDPDDSATQLPTLAEIAELVEARRAAKKAREAAATARRRARRTRDGRSSRHKAFIAP